IAVGSRSFNAVSPTGSALRAPSIPKLGGAPPPGFALPPAQRHPRRAALWDCRATSKHRPVPHPSLSHQGPRKSRGSLLERLTTGQLALYVTLCSLTTLFGASLVGYLITRAQNPV